MRGLLIATFAGIVTLGGCVEPQPQPQSPTVPPTSAVPPTVAMPPTPAATLASPAVADPGKNPPAAPPVAPRVAPPVARSAAPPLVPPVLPAEAAAARSTQLPTPRSPAQAAPASRAESPTPANSPAAVTESAKPPVPPPLDLSGLEQRLRDTSAIGVFTKLSLKNQVDDLLAQFRGFYKGQAKVPLAQLRQRYELLLLKVVSLIQDADQQLASAIDSSREAIWDILADPEKFAKI